MMIHRHPMIPIRPLLKASLGNSRAAAAAPLFGEGREHYFPSGRIALTYALKEVGCTPQDRLLLPAYHCASEVSVASQFTRRLSYFRITDTLAIDVDDLARKIDASTKAVIVIHYFGFPSDGFSAVRALCRERNIALVEDCAHVLPHPHDAAPLGRLGDYSIFSLWKILPVPNGGLFKNNRSPSAEPEPLRRSVDLGTTALTLKSLLKRTRYDYTPPPATAAKQTTMERFISVGDVSARISPLSLRMAAQLDHLSIFQARRENFLHLLKSLRFNGAIRPLVTSVPDAICPFYFPLVVNRGLRDRLRDRLLEQGIETVPWWIYTHQDFPVEQYHEALRLKESVLALPIHHDLNPGDLEMMAERIDRVVRSWAAS